MRQFTNLFGSIKPMELFVRWLKTEGQKI